MRKLKPYLPYIIFALSAVLLIIRAFYGFCWSDETFYISTVKRFFDGDLIFADEWFPTQLSSLIMLPFYALYTVITGSTDGIILFFRLLYIILSFLISCITYRILCRSYPAPAAFTVSEFMLLYAHLNIATMSYYTLSFQFFVLAMIIISAGSRRAYITGGFIFALSVLCLPSLAVAYFCAVFILLICSVHFPSLRRGLILTFAGIAAAAALFVIYLYASGNSMDNLFRYLPYILSDEEHQTSLVAPFKKFFTSVYDVFGVAFYFSIALSALSFLTYRFRNLIPVFFGIDIVFFIYYLAVSIGHTGYINTALALTALPLFCMNRKKDWYSFFALYAGGLAVSMTYSYSSNGELYVMTIGHGIACTAAILFISDFISENHILFGYILYGMLVLFLLQTAFLRITNVYRDAPLNELTVLIHEGPAAGLFTTGYHADSYDKVLKAVHEIDTQAHGNDYIFFSKLLPWGYLATDMKCGAPTTWRTKISSKRLESYFSKHPDRIPSVIFILDDDIGTYDSCGDVEADPSPNENECSGWLMNFIEKNGYRKTVTDCGIIYAEY